MRSADPYWWLAATPPTIPQQYVQTISDVAIVGAGYTGLSAAITLARAGRSVQVFDKQRPGEGASTRNGGITSGNLRPGYAEMVRKFGKERADAIQAEAIEARNDLYRFIAEEGIDCDFKLVGRFLGAATPQHYETNAREAERLAKSLGIEAYAVPKGEQHGFLGTDYYYGGSVRMDIGGLHPAKLHAEMVRLALAAGVVIHGETAVQGIEAKGDKFEVRTARGTVTAAHVIAGPNGYADGSDKWVRRRLVPVRSRIIATEPLSPNLMGALMPRRMMLSDSRANHYYYRPSPDGTRILFGGRDGTIAGDAEWPITALRTAMTGIFPELKDVELSNSWFGHVAMNRDMVPRIFSHNGVRYAAGYCGSGVVWARWAGKKAALQVLGEAAGKSAFDFRPPAAVPFFSGKSWFMPAVFSWMSFKDSRTAKVRAKLAAEGKPQSPQV
ncbi:FAD-binding oxidoreductase [Acidisphaera sp. L21]|uniref:NAD(P)/FAD-dependent oxidoreductase n=1 Tax=Acidisphaera sp. L21 TaxID=1641851 RepID=UPI00131B85C0|nr:FAD-binding oxidoreductase [Acidisphaera sp. L21]